MPGKVCLIETSDNRMNLDCELNNHIVSVLKFSDFIMVLWFYKTMSLFQEIKTIVFRG